jgi:hypothetical protein
MARRLIPLCLLVVLAITSCGDTSPSTTTSNAGQSSDSNASTTTSNPAEAAPSGDRPAAPDFSLELGDGGTYTLSAGEKPVYLVFWAEW